MAHIASLKMGDWRSMNTAPLDGTLVELDCEDGGDLGYFARGEWSTAYGNGEPSGWLPFMGGAFRWQH